jgi:hypothetical protein
VEVALQSGFVRIEGKNAAFVDPVRVLSAGYEFHDVKSERYYARSFFTSAVSVSSSLGGTQDGRKRKRKRKVYTLNEKEAVAEIRHQVRHAIGMHCLSSLSISNIIPVHRDYGSLLCELFV